jgi:hypothetical protein
MVDSLSFDFCLKRQQVMWETSVISPFLYLAFVCHLAEVGFRAYLPSGYLARLRKSELAGHYDEALHATS